MSELDPRERFTATAGAYARWRPSYPPEAIAWLERAAALAPGAAVVDLGTGTGIVARLFAARGYAVIGVDPNASMLERARAEGGGARYVQGEAAATTLPGRSAQLVVAAQAFHWFSIPETLPELRRILAPSGVAAAMWNVRDDTPFMRDYEALLERLSVYRETPRPEPTLAALEARPEVIDRARFVARHAQAFDRQGLHGRAGSSSYVAHASAAERAQLADALDAAFDAHAVDGQVAFAYRTEILAFRVA